MIARAAAPALSRHSAINARTIDSLATLDLYDNLDDAGPLPSSQPLKITLHLAPTTAQTAALQSLLAAQTDPDSPNFQHWLTPEQFASQFGPTDDQLDRFRAWIESQGLAVESISPSRSRLAVTGTAAQIESAFAPHLRRLQVAGQPHFAPSFPPTVPAELSPDIAQIAEISGLDDLPPAFPLRISEGAPQITQAQRISPAQRASSLDPPTRNRATGRATEVQPDSLTHLADILDANTSPVVTLTNLACDSPLTPSDLARYQALMRQAGAQGITVIVSAACDSPSGLPSTSIAALPEVTALAGVSTSTTDPRPAWQLAPGLPPDLERHTPDLTSPSPTALADAIRAVVAQTGRRQGNINRRLYALRSTPGLYTQPDSSTAGSWQPATGLGLVDLPELIKALPRTGALVATTTSIESSTYAVPYGNTVTLTSKVLAGSYPTAAPTGVVTFSASTQGVIGTGTIDSAGNATLISGNLPVGSYSLTASYSGDAIYSPSTSTGTATVAVSIVNATLLATIAPVTNVPYGATATVTATVSLPGSSAAPSGNVSAQVEGVTGANFVAILTPNPGGNTATANIVVSIPKPGSYTISITCAGNTNFQCQTPVILPFKAILGNTLITVAATPAAPQAGQPIALTATIANAGNGTGVYNFGGSITFYDNGVLLATAPVATNQATTTKTLAGNRTHNIVATYTGDPNWNPGASAAVAVTPTLLSSAVTLSASIPNPPSALAGINIGFTATVVTTVLNNPGPTGTVTFYDTFNGVYVTLGTATLASNGPSAAIAQFNTVRLTAGTHHIFATYAGDDNFMLATSAPATLTLTDFALTMTPSTLTLNQGRTAQVVTTIGLVNGFNGSVAFGCTPPPNSEASCSFSPATVVGAGSSTLTIITAGPQTQVSHRTVSRAGPGAPAAITLALASGLLFNLRRRSHLPSLLLALLASACLGSALGCGLVTTAGNNSPTPTPSNPGTPLGTQNFTITAAGSDGVSTARHTFSYQVTVQ